jgi:hypothetical protein
VPEIDFTTPLSSEEVDSTLDAIARRIVERRLEAPAILFLESHKPLSFLAGQGVAAAIPFLGPLIGPERVAKLSLILQTPENVDLLVRKIELLAADSG